jgi:hypothetical protein
MVKKTNEFNFIENERRTTRPNIKIKQAMIDYKKSQNPMYETENDEAYNSEDEFGEGIYKGKNSTIHIHGGALAANEIRGLLDASYDKDIKDVDGGWVQDEELSTGKSKVFYNPTTGKTSVVHRGTVGTASDWANNAAYALGGETLYKTTDRYKKAKEVQKAAEQKYGRDNLITLGHSQGGLQAELLGKKGDETFTLNKATRPFSNEPSKNQTDIRTTTDWVSALNPFSSAGKTELISLKGYNPLKAHATTSMKKLGSKMLGFGIHSDSDSSSDDEDDHVIQSVLFKRPEWKLKDCKAYLKQNGMKTTQDTKKDHYRFRQVDPKKLKDYEYKTVNKGNDIQHVIAYKEDMKGGALFGKISKGFNKTIVQPTKQVVQKEIVQPTKAIVKKEIVQPTKAIVKDTKDEIKKDIKYVSSKDGLATDLLYKGVPVVAGTLGGIAGTMLTGGPMGGMAGSYAGQMAGKMIAQKVGRKTKMGSEAQRGVGTKKQSSNKTVRKYITKKKGGLSSDLLHHGVPIATGALGGIAGTMLGGPMGGMAGSQAGSYAGQYASDQIGKKIGVGLKRGRGRPRKDSVNIDIDFNSHNARENSKTMTGGKLKKGSPEMAEKMARLRALKIKK